MKTSEPLRFIITGAGFWGSIVLSIIGALADGMGLERIGSWCFKKVLKCEDWMEL